MAFVPLSLVGLMSLASFAVFFGYMALATVRFLARSIAGAVGRIVLLCLVFPFVFVLLVIVVFGSMELGLRLTSDTTILDVVRAQVAAESATN